MDLGTARFADTIVLAPRRRVDREAAEAFREALLRRLVPCLAGDHHVVLDFGAVGSIASGGSPR